RAPARLARPAGHDPNPGTDPARIERAAVRPGPLLVGGPRRDGGRIRRGTRRGLAFGPRPRRRPDEPGDRREDSTIWDSASPDPGARPPGRLDAPDLERRARRQAPDRLPRVPCGP